MTDRQAYFGQQREPLDLHLRSSKEIIGYEIMTTDGPLGSVGNFIFADTSWAIRYMSIDTRKWLSVKHILPAPEWIESVSCSEHKVFVNVTQQAVEDSPEYDPSHLLSREYEARLYAYYQRAIYWL